MAPLKASGIDGFHVKVYQSQWETIRESICSLVRKVLGVQGLDPKITRTLID